MLLRELLPFDLATVLLDCSIEHAKLLDYIRDGALQHDVLVASDPLPLLFIGPQAANE